MKTKKNVLWLCRQKKKKIRLSQNCTTIRRKKKIENFLKTQKLLNFILKIKKFKKRICLRFLMLISKRECAETVETIKKTLRKNDRQMKIKYESETPSVKNKKWRRRNEDKLADTGCPNAKANTSALDRLLDRFKSPSKNWQTNPSCDSRPRTFTTTKKWLSTKTEKQKWWKNLKTENRDAEMTQNFKRRILIKACRYSAKYNVHLKWFQAFSRKRKTLVSRLNNMYIIITTSNQHNKPRLHKRGRILQRQVDHLSNAQLVKS